MLGLLSELDIINAMLATTGTAPLTAEDDTHPDYVKARNMLRDVSREVQNLKLWFNTSTVTLALDTDSRIVLPKNTLTCNPVDTRLNYVHRGTYLFNTDDNSYVIPAATKCLLCVFLPVDGIPSTAQHYIRAKARYEYYLDEDGTEPKLTKYREAQSTTWAACWREHIRNRDINYFRGKFNAGLAMRRGSQTYRRIQPSGDE